MNKIPVCAGPSTKTGMQVIGNVCCFHNPYILRQSGIKRRDKTLRFNPRYIGKKMSSLPAGMDARIGSPRTEKLDGMLMQQRQRPLDFPLYGAERFFPVLQLLLPSVEPRAVIRYPKQDIPTERNGISRHRFRVIQPSTHHRGRGHVPKSGRAYFWRIFRGRTFLPMQFYAFPAA